MKCGGHFFLEFLAGFEFHRGAGWNGDILTGLFQIASDLGFHLADFKGSEVAHHHSVSLSERFRDFIDECLHHFKDDLLGEFRVLGSQQIGDFYRELALGDGGHKKMNGWDNRDAGRLNNVGGWFVL